MKNAAGEKPAKEEKTGTAVKTKDGEELILMESPGFTVIQRSVGTPHFCHNSTDFLGPMNGTGISFPFSSVVVIPLLITCAAHSADI